MHRGGAGVASRRRIRRCGFSEFASAVPAISDLAIVLPAILVPATTGPAISGSLCVGLFFCCDLGSSVPFLLQQAPLSLLFCDLGSSVPFLLRLRLLCLCPHPFVVAAQVDYALRDPELGLSALVSPGQDGEPGEVGAVARGAAAAELVSAGVTGSAELGKQRGESCW